jgi:hypothetical protein
MRFGRNGALVSLRSIPFFCFFTDGCFEFPTKLKKIWQEKTYWTPYYKLMSNLQVRMGNNSFLPVLGHSSAVISLNGQRILVRNALHVPGLVVPLYSLRAHFTQRSCGFLGASGVGILVYFPTFVLSVNTSKDCHLAYKSLGCSAPLDSLHYIQPQCSPSLYSSELSSTLAAKQVGLLYWLQLKMILRH